MAVIAFSCASVIGSELWFRFHEQTSDPYSISFNTPATKSGFRDLPITDNVRGQLLYDAGHSVMWQNADGTKWQVYYFRWNPAHTLTDRVRVQLARTHRPEICLPSGGRVLSRRFAPERVEVSGAAFLFQTYEFEESGGPLYVFFSVREDGRPDELVNVRGGHRARLMAALEGNRGAGQRVVEIIIRGARDYEFAKACLLREFPKLVSVAPLSSRP